MRATQLTTLLVSMLLISCQPTGPSRVEIPVSKTPSRASNEEVVERVPGETTPTTKKTPTETAVAQTPAAGAEKPTNVAVTEKPQASTKPAGAPTKSTSPLAASRTRQPTAKNYGAERNRMLSQ